MKQKNLTRFLITSLMGGLLFTGPAVMVADSTIVVKPSAMDGWVFRTAHAFGGTITSTAGFEVGPATPPLGTGSAEMTTGSDGDSFAELRNGNYHGVLLSDITTMTYSTYVTTRDPSSCVAPYILLSVDVDGDGDFDPAGSPDDGLFFEPCYQTGGYVTDPPGQIVPVQNGGMVPLNTWQPWDAKIGGWWSAKYVGLGGPPLTLLPNYLARLAGLGFTTPRIANSGACLGGVRIRSGPGAGAWPNFEGNADNFTIGVSGVNTTYDFEFEDLPIPQCGATPATALTACKFYDLDADGVKDITDLPLSGWPITIDPLGAAVPNQATQLTGVDGCVSWGNLDHLLNPYTVSEGTPIQGNWVHSTPSSVNVNAVTNQTSTVDFGNYCRVGSGGKTIGFWGNKNGQALITNDDLAVLRACNLVKANGSPFNPASKGELKSWLQDANATNMAYMLSAQLAAMKLNVEHGFVNPNAFALCFNGTIAQLISAADAALLADGFTPAGDPNRTTQEALKNCLDALNNGGLVVPPTPCAYSFGESLQSFPVASGRVGGVTNTIVDQSWNVKAMFP